jgi:succinate dehydrogenase hydrophobic anchor subunit
MSAVKTPERTLPRPQTTVRTPRVHEYPGRRSARAWRWTAGSGIALVVLVTAHVVAQHFVVHGTGGLRTYQQVLDFVANPVMFVIECGFLFAVTIHAMLGLRSVLHDVVARPRARSRIDRTLWVVGTLTVAYGLVLLITIAIRA